VGLKTLNRRVRRGRRGKMIKIGNRAKPIFRRYCHSERGALCFCRVRNLGEPRELSRFRSDRIIARLARFLIKPEIISASSAV